MEIGELSLHLKVLHLKSLPTFKICTDIDMNMIFLIQHNAMIFTYHHSWSYAGQGMVVG